MYVGKLEHPRVPIEDGDNDKAHVDRDAAKVIRYIHAFPDTHKYIIDKTLKPGVGISHDVFNAPDLTARTGKPEGDAEEGDPDTSIEKKTARSIGPVDDLMNLQYHIYVPEVVRE